MAALVIIPVKTILVECIHVIWVPIKKKILTSSQNEICSFFRWYSLFFQFFFTNERSHLDYYLDLNIQFGKKNGNRKVYGNLKLRQIPPQKQPEMFCAVFLWDMSSQPQQSTRTNCYSSLEYREFLQQNSIQRILVFPYNPSSNGLAENYCPTSKYVVKSSAADTAEDF